MTGRARIVGYGLALAGFALLLDLLDVGWRIRTLATEVYLVVVALLFAALGAWVAVRVLPRRAAPDVFEPNAKAIEYLGITDREGELLGMLADGSSNREIARRAFISENTVKTHLSSLYGKLDVSRRTQAVRKARELGILP
jgi:DNA-binding CsgD family transcriptional regulator